MPMPAHLQVMPRHGGEEAGKGAVNVFIAVAAEEIILKQEGDTLALPNVVNL